MSSMKEFYNDPKKSYPLTLEDLNKDQFFAARHTDSLWYRVKINSQLVTTCLKPEFVPFLTMAIV